MEKGITPEKNRPLVETTGEHQSTPGRKNICTTKINDKNGGSQENTLFKLEREKGGKLLGSFACRGKG